MSEPLDKQRVVDHYEASLAQHGPVAAGMDWKDEASQQLRFAMLCDTLELDGKSLLDVGAGAGHLLDFVSARGDALRYHGLDLSVAMVDSARRLHPDATFEHRDLVADPPSNTFDFVLCSGMFHVKLDHADEVWFEFVTETLRAMYDRCRVAIAFNLMSDQVDYRAPNLYYASPSGVFDFCRHELSRWVSLRHDYPLHEFTIHVHREGRSV